MKDIREIAPKPSDALQAMVDGLREQDLREDFEIDMDYFGKIGSNKMCFGCAATCALQKISGVKLNKTNIEYTYTRSSAFKIENAVFLEHMFDSARQGLLTNLFLHYEVNINEAEIGNLLYPDFCLETDNWREELPKLEAYISLLKSKNL